MRFRRRGRVAFESVDLDGHLIQELMPGIWGLNEAHAAKPYLEHYRDLVSKSPFVPTSANLVELVGIVKANAEKPLEEILTLVQAAASSWDVRDIDLSYAKLAVDLAFRLSLFVGLHDISDLTLTPGVIIQTALPAPIFMDASSPADRRVPENFGMKLLTRVGGFKFSWTSCLDEHLTLIGSSQVRIFRHAAVLRAYSLKSER
jgi:hypothetical protein